MRNDLPTERAASGSFFAPKSKTKTAARISRCQGLNSPMKVVLPRGYPRMVRRSAPWRGRSDPLELVAGSADALAGSRDVPAELAYLPPQPQRQIAQNAHTQDAHADEERHEEHGPSLGGAPTAGCRPGRGAGPPPEG